MWRWVLLLASVTAGLVAYVVRPGTRLFVPEHSAVRSPLPPANGPANKSMKSKTKAELLEQARGLAIRGRSKMTKEELVRAIRVRSDRASQTRVNPAG